MIRQPDLNWKLCAADERAKREAAQAEAAKLRVELEQERAKVTRWINRNTVLWNVLAKLPGGLEAARRLGP